MLETPLFKFGEDINDFDYDCPERRYLVTFIHSFGSHRIRQTSTPRIRERPNCPNHSLNRIASELWKIKHWEIRHGSYLDIENQEATWFIDPPYQTGGHSYPESNKKIDFDHLSAWCQQREGQTIVCENMKADWLPFKPMTHHYTLSGRYSEAIWSNLPTPFDHIQTSLLEI